MTGLNSFADAADPTQTLSGTLPSVPADDGLSVLDPRFPIELGDNPRSFFWATLHAAGRAGYTSLAMAETARATQHDAVATVRYVQPLSPEPVPTPYPALAPAALDDDWDTATRTAVLAGTGKRRGPNGRFLPAADEQGDRLIPAGGGE